MMDAKAVMNANMNAKMNAKSEMLVKSEYDSVGYTLPADGYDLLSLLVFLLWCGAPRF